MMTKVNHALLQTIPEYLMNFDFEGSIAQPIIKVEFSCTGVVNDDKSNLVI